MCIPKVKGDLNLTSVCTVLFVAQQKGAEGEMLLRTPSQWEIENKIKKENKSMMF